MFRRIIRWLWVGLILITGCTSAVPSSITTPTFVLTPTETPTPLQRLTVSLLYPKVDSELEMGQPIKFIAQASDDQGKAVNAALMTITIYDPNGVIVASLPAIADKNNVYRAEWIFPHRQSAGTWHVIVEARTGDVQGTGTGNFKVKNSTSEDLLSKYGFWLDAPTLRGIVPQIVAERGDAHNGLLRWGGQIASQHVLPANWVEIHWREGDYKLDSPAAVRQFVLVELGDLGFTPVRDIGPFQSIHFKQWAAWQAEARAQFAQDQMEWLVFYAPEFNKTYAIATTVVLPPGGINPHAQLRSSFAVSPDSHAASVAPEPLVRLLPGPELLSPPLGARFLGSSAPIVLRWNPVKVLTKDEYYEVAVDFNYIEDNPLVKFTTRQTQLTLPVTLYRTPNCGVFNWQVTLKRQTGLDDTSQPTGEVISYHSLYWYVEWRYPPEEARAFPLKCPNPQF